MIQVEKLKKTYSHRGQRVEAVRGVSFRVRPGEIFGFLGPNGAGKTTTIHMLCTLVCPTEGEAWLNGFHVVDQPHQVRRSIGLVFQEPTLDDRLTAWENLEFHGMIYGVSRRRRRERIRELLRLVELEDRAHSLVNTFSGGMRRRLEIARSLVHDPPVLFLDEPTLGLDPQTRRHIWEYLHWIRKERGVTLFLTTHYMDEAEHCDRIAIMDHGRIIALGTPEELKQQVGGDVITLQAENGEEARRFLEETFGVVVRNGDHTLSFEVERGEEVLPQVIRKARFPIRAISVRRPTLEDVFIKLTGHAIREEPVDGAEIFRMQARLRRR